MLVTSGPVTRKINAMKATNKTHDNGEKRFMGMTGTAAFVLF